MKSLLILLESIPELGGYFTRSFCSDFEKQNLRAHCSNKDENGNSLNPRHVRLAIISFANCYNF